MKYIITWQVPVGRAILHTEILLSGHRTRHSSILNRRIFAISCTLYVYSFQWICSTTEKQSILLHYTCCFTIMLFHAALIPSVIYMWYIHTYNRYTRARMDCITFIKRGHRLYIFIKWFHNNLCINSSEHKDAILNWNNFFTNFTFFAVYWVNWMHVFFNTFCAERQGQQRIRATHASQSSTR